MYNDAFMNFSPIVFSASKQTKFNTPDNRESYGHRVVKHYEFEIINDGTGEIETNGKMIKTEARRLFIRTPKMEVEGFTPYHSTFIVFDFNSDLDIPSQLENLPAYIDVNDFTSINELFDIIYTEVLNPTSVSNLNIKACLCKIFAYVINYINHKSFAYNDVIADSINYINDNLASILTTETLSKDTGYSINHYIRMFKQYAGLTPIDYINKQRIYKSIKLLDSTNMPIEAIAIECGFTNSSYFFRIFKDITGKTPSCYRKNNRIYNQIREN